MYAPCGEGVSYNVDKGGQGRRGLAVSGPPFQRGLCNRENGI